MRKVDHLRAYLLRAVPTLKDQSDRLHTSMNRGTVRSVMGKTLSYKVEYDAVVMIEDFAGETDHVIVPLLAWIAEQEPLLLHPDYAGLPFEMDILDNKTADMQFRIPLTERVIVTTNPDGSWTATYPADTVLPINFDGADPPHALWQLWGTRFAETLGEERGLITAHPDHLP